MPLQLDAEEADVLELDLEEAWRSHSRMATTLVTTVLDAAACDAALRGRAWRR